MRTILLVNGPNLNLLGTREPKLYGNTTLAEITAKLTTLAAECKLKLESFQSNHEGALIDTIQEAKTHNIAGIIINPGALSHTSIGLRDVLITVAIPFIEVHVSNIYARESFRHHSYLSDIADGVIAGLGPLGYELALQALSAKLS